MAKLVPSDKQTVEKILSLRTQAESAQRELAGHEARAEQAGQKAAEIEQALTGAGFDVTGDLTAQLASASAAVERELSAIAGELEGLR